MNLLGKWRQIVKKSYELNQSWDKDIVQYMDNMSRNVSSEGLNGIWLYVESVVYMLVKEYAISIWIFKQ